MELDRREFLKASATFGFTTAAIAAAGGLLGSPEAQAHTAREEARKRKAATTVVNLATAYRIGATRGYPLMQLDFKENLECLSAGELYVNLHHGGKLGAGGSLVQKVREGTIQMAQHSMSNFAPYAPEVDLINIPYWCGDNQSFTNLVYSKTWQNEIHPKIEAKGFKPLWYVVVDPRLVALRRGKEGPIRHPDQLKGVKFRVSGSLILQKFYRLLGANPTPIAWSETPSAIKQGVADAVDSSVQALNIFGFRDVLGDVSFIGSVQDSSMYSCNFEWFKSLPKKTQEAIEFASEITARQNLAKVPVARAFAMREMAQANVRFTSITPEEKEAWIKRGGHALPVWNDTKKELAGSLSNFERLLKAAKTLHPTYRVHDVV